MHTSTPVLPGLSHWWWEDGRWYRGRFFLPCLIRRNLVGRIFPVASVRALVELVGLRHWISAQTLSFNCSWSQDRNSIQPSRAATMWLVTTHEAFQLSWADRVGSSSASFFLFCGNSGDLLPLCGFFYSIWYHRDKVPPLSFLHQLKQFSHSRSDALHKSHSFWRDSSSHHTRPVVQYPCHIIHHFCPATHRLSYPCCMCCWVYSVDPQVTFSAKKLDKNLHLLDFIPQTYFSFVLCFMNHSFLVFIFKYHTSTCVLY